MVRHFVGEFCGENGFRDKQVEPAVLERLIGYEWPGNVRELKNIIERVVIMSDEVIQRRRPAALLPAPRPGRASTSTRFADRSLRDFREEMEKEFILHAPRAARVEHLARRRLARHRAHQPAQEAQGLRHPARALTTIGVTSLRAAGPGCAGRCGPGPRWRSVRPLRAARPARSSPRSGRAAPRRAGAAPRRALRL